MANWDETTVRDFLEQSKLATMLLLCAGINGTELLQLYEMCKANAVAMYQSLKSELSKTHQQVLPIMTFLQFMNGMRLISNDTNTFPVSIPIEWTENDSIDDSLA